VPSYILYRGGYFPGGCAGPLRICLGRVGANTLGDDRNCCHDSDHLEHHTDADGESHSDQDGREDNDRDRAHTDERRRQDAYGHYLDPHVDQPRRGCGGRRRRGGRKQRAILRIERSAGVGVGVDRRCRRRWRDLDRHLDSARPKRQFTERRDGRPGSIGRRAAAARRAASSMSASGSLAACLASDSRQAPLLAAGPVSRHGGG
jgi:hypothetical protein